MTDQTRTSIIAGWFRSLRALVPYVAVLTGVTLYLQSLGNAPIKEQTAHADADTTPSLAFLDHSGEVFRRVAKAVSPGVVYIESKQRDKAGEIYNEEAGSGVLIKIDGFERPIVVTNLHVVVNAAPRDIDVLLSDGRQLQPKQVWSDRDTDLAALDLGESGLPSVATGDSDLVHVGQWVLAIGSPFGLTQSVTHGIVSATERRQLGLPQSMRIKEFIQTDAAINPGNSGGPLVNLRAQVIGINTAIASRTGGSSGVGFAIPALIVQRVVSDLVKYGQVRRAYLGVEFPVTFNRDEAIKLGLPAARGAMVASVNNGTPAAVAGLKAGDVILEFNGKSIEDDNHLINMVSQASAGETVRLKVWRKRQAATVDIKLGDWNTFQNASATTTVTE